MDHQGVAAGQRRLEPVQAVQQGKRTSQLTSQETEIQLALTKKILINRTQNIRGLGLWICIHICGSGSSCLNKLLNCKKNPIELVQIYLI